ncbi:MAG: hypothetical protein WC473_04935 [Patescibacteria group bacterium]|jgi:hypothetical protein
MSRIKINKKIIWAFVLFLAGTTLIIVIIYPTANKIITIRQEILKERQDLEKKLAMGLNANKIKEETDAVEKIMPRLRQVYIKPGQELEFLNYLDNLAAKNSLIIDIKPDFTGKALSPEVTRLPIELIISGKFESVLTALNELERRETYFIIDVLSLTAQNDGLVAAAVSGNIYRQENKIATTK